MGDTAGELAHRLHLLGLQQLALALFAVGDVDDRAVADLAPGLIGIDLDDLAHPDDAAIGAQQAVFHAAVAEIIAGILHPGAHALAVVGVDHGHGQRRIGPLLRRVTEQLLDLGADIAVALGCDVPGIGQHSGRLHEVPQAMLALPQLALALLAVGDVDDRAVADAATSFVSLDLDDVAHPHGAAVGLEHAVLRAAIGGLAEELPQLAFHARAVVGMHDREPARGVHPLLWRMAEEALDLGPDIAVALGLYVPGVGHDSRGFHEVAHAPLALA